MTDKEMHRLSRRELLQLLLAQVSETEELKALLAERDEQLITLNENYERLRKRLDQKDAKIHDLRETMRKERTARRIELQEAGSIAEAALRLNGIFELAQKAADQYLENVRILTGDLEPEEEVPDDPGEQDDMDGNGTEAAGGSEPEGNTEPAGQDRQKGHYGQEDEEGGAGAGDACSGTDKGGAAEGES